MNTAAFLAWVNAQSADSLQTITQSDNRLLAAAAGQVLQARQAKQLGDAKLVTAHMRKAFDFWGRAQQRDELQVASAIEKIAAVRQAVQS